MKYLITWNALEANMNGGKDENLLCCQSITNNNRYRDKTK